MRTEVTPALAITGISRRKRGGSSSSGRPGLTPRNGGGPLATGCDVPSSLFESPPPQPARTSTSRRARTGTGRRTSGAGYAASILRPCRGPPTERLSTVPDVAGERGTGTTRLLFGMALASGITSVPSAAIVLALPTLHKEFDASLTELQWTVTGYLLAYSAFMIAAGRLADVFGRKRLLVIGTFVYAGASVVGALADSALMLIAALIVVGIGAAVLTPGSLAIVTNAFRGGRRAMAVGVWGAASALFSGFGPALGGLFTDELSWRWILWFNVIIAAGILFGVRGGEESRDETVSPRIDVAGLVLSVAGLAAIVLALNEAPTWELTSPKVLGLLVGGALLLAAFCVVERRIREPLIDLAMFAQRNVSGAAIVVFVLNFAFGAVLFFIPLYLQEFLGYDPLEAGFLLLPASATMMIGMPLGARLFDRIGPLPPIVGGMAISGVGMLLLSGIDESTEYSDLWFPLGLEGLGLGVA